MILAEKYKSILNKYEVNTPLRLAYLFAQIEHESGLVPISENFNYSAKRLLVVFPKYFTNLEFAKKFEKQPEKIANLVYANRMGNGNEQSGDGWHYRGRGFLQNTGSFNYKKLTKDTGINFYSDPDLLLTEANAIIAALSFWKENNLNYWSDKNNIIKSTKIINGGLKGLDKRRELLVKYKTIFV